MSGFSMRNCPKCGNVFTFVRNPICQECQAIEDETFETVRHYIKENGDKTLEEVAEATEVSVKKILKYIRDGKIELSSNEGISFPCENCGKPISMGRYCAPCAAKIKNKFNANFSKPVDLNTEKPKSVMYTQQNK